MDPGRGQGGSLRGSSAEGVLRTKNVFRRVKILKIEISII